MVKVAACGICGTDLHILDGEFAPTLPVVPGHEFAGEVVAVGAEVTEFAAGDQVAVDPSLYCGECHYCRRAAATSASVGRDRRHDRRRRRRVRPRPGRQLRRLPEHVDTGDAALIEPLSCAVRGFDVLPVALADHYLIYGAGHDGPDDDGAGQAGRARRAVDVVDLNPDRLDDGRAARLLGRRHQRRRARPARAAGTSSSTAPASPPRSRTGCPGSARRHVPAVRGGRLPTRVQIEPYRIYNQEITITGSMAVLHSFERAGDLFVNGALRPDA